MSLPALRIGHLQAKLPIIQGGMAVGISRCGLASAVANEGGIGVLGTAMIGMNEPDVAQNPVEANNRALRNELRNARAAAPNGLIGINIMMALTLFAESVKTSIEEGADIIFAGAGLPLELPKYLLDLCEQKKQEFKTCLVPIVSSARAAGIIAKKWLNRFDYLPDAFVVEGPMAGGHLGFSADQLDNPEFALDKLVPATVEVVKQFEDKKGRAIPVIAAGGIFTGADILKFLNLGASGVQMGTRFVATHECDADIRFKEAYVNAKAEDATIIKSPVGMPGRALYNEFIQDSRDGKRKPVKCVFHCLHTCDPETTPYCIALSLISAMKGNLSRGFAFCGSNVGRVSGITSVHELIESLKAEYEAALAAQPA